jgi:hypothetical protein
MSRRNQGGRGGNKPAASNAQKIKFDSNSKKKNDTGFTSRLVREVRILQYGRDGNNYDDWEKEMMLYSEKNYQLLASFWHTGEYYEPPNLNGAYDLVDFNEQNDPLGIQRQMLLEEYKLNLKERNDLEKSKISLFADIWSTLSRNSEQAIQQHADFDEKIRPRKDP